MKAKIILLKTESQSNLIENNSIELFNNKLELTIEFNTDFKRGESKSQHIYLTDPNAEIKEGGWCYQTVTKKIINAPFDCKDDSRFAKIICSTDKSLSNPNKVQYGNMNMIDVNGDSSYYYCTNCEVEFSRSKEELVKAGVLISQLSEQSIKLLIDYYNKNGKMPDEVEVKTENYNKHVEHGSIAYGGWIKRIKLNPQGTVDIIIPEEKMYTREEVRNLIDTCYGDIIHFDNNY